MIRLASAFTKQKQRDKFTAKMNQFEEEAGVVVTTILMKKATGLKFGCQSKKSLLFSDAVLVKKLCQCCIWTKKVNLNNRWTFRRNS
jgi:hypothetical protein